MIILKNIVSKLLCFVFPQCSVENEVGETRGDGCLTIVLAIDVKYQPQPTQEIVKGDEIDLTVQASWETGVDIEKLSRTWTFGNRSGDLELTLPPFAEIVDNNRVIINTSKLTDEQYKTVDGRYTFVIKNSYEEKIITTSVSRVDPVPTEPPVSKAAARASTTSWDLVIFCSLLSFKLVLLLPALSKRI